MVPELAADYWVIVHRDLRRAACVRAVIEWIGQLFEERKEALAGTPPARLTSDGLGKPTPLRDSARRISDERVSHNLAVAADIRAEGRSIGSVYSQGMTRRQTRLFAARALAIVYPSVSP